MQREALDLAFAEYALVLRQFVASLLSQKNVGHLIDANEIVGEVYLVAAAKHDTLRDSKKFWPWLRGIARNLASNRMRTVIPEEQRRREIEDVDSVGSPSGDPVIEEIISQEKSTLCREFVAELYSTLSHEDQIVIQHIMDGTKTSHDLAGALKSVGSSGARARQARLEVRLRRQFGPRFEQLFGDD